MQRAENKKPGTLESSGGEANLVRKQLRPSLSGDCWAVVGMWCDLVFRPRWADSFDPRGDSACRHQATAGVVNRMSEMFQDGTVSTMETDALAGPCCVKTSREQGHGLRRPRRNVRDYPPSDGRPASSIRDSPCVIEQGIADAMPMHAQRPCTGTITAAIAAVSWSAHRGTVKGVDLAQRRVHSDADGVALV